MPFIQPEIIEPNHTYYVMAVDVKYKRPLYGMKEIRTMYLCNKVEENYDEAYDEAYDEDYNFFSTSYITLDYLLENGIFFADKEELKRDWENNKEAIEEENKNKFKILHDTKRIIKVRFFEGEKF